MPLLILGESAQAQDGTLDERREAWVIKAREGQGDEAIAGLSQLYANTDDQAVLDDLIALMIRDQRYRQALNACADCRVEDYSTISLEALGMAARQAGELSKAEAYYQVLTHRQPSNVQGWLGRALTDIALEHYAAAGDTLQRIERRFGTSDSSLRARIRLAEHREAIIAELQARQRLIERQGQDATQLQALYRLALSLGARNAAQRLLRDHPEAFRRTDRQWLHYYGAVERIRLARSTDDVTHAQEALEALETVLAAPNAAQELRRRARFDRVVALTLLRRFDEAEALARRLETRYGSLPDHVVRARADALLGLGRPNDALVRYQALAASRPALKRDAKRPLNTSLFYAYADARRFQDAQALLDEWRAQEPPRRWDFTGTSRIPNPNDARVRQLQVMLTAWRGDEAAASRRLEDLLDQAPGNVTLWNTRGDLHRWRGWPRQAQQDYRRATRLTAPRDRQTAEYGMLLSRLDRDQWRGTVERIETRVREDAPSGTLDHLNRALTEQRAGGLSVESSRGQSDGVDTRSSRDWRYEARLEAPRNAAGSRFFAQRIGQFGEFDGDALHAAYTTAGYAFNVYPAQLSLAVGNGARLNDEPLVWSELDYAFTDHWSAELGVEINSDQTPLRALHDDVNADLYRLEARYRRDESGAGAFGLTLLDLEDDNLRRSVHGDWRERLYHHDAWRLEGEVSAAASRNDDVEASYFNPSRDASVNARLDTTYSLPLGYRQAFDQVLSLGVGDYWQEDAGSAVTWEIGYVHRWSLEPEFTLEYGMSRRRAVFDGLPEYDTAITVGFDWRFL
jgi:poly-beta-1,6 N-acetyl-D-glucosamine export porin PgaA